MKIDSNNPTPHALLIFALLWAAFCALLGLIAGARPEAMLHAGVFTLVCAVVAIVFDTETPLRSKLKSLVIPGSLFVLWLVGVGAGGGAVRWGLIGFGVGGTLAMLASRGLATRFYRFWMEAGKPIGWTVSTVLLGVVYLLVVTPVGLVMRVFGHDPMARGFDKRRDSYWTDRPPPAERKRYFRQF